jgi:hypothetical protein
MKLVTAILLCACVRGVLAQPIIRAMDMLQTVGSPQATPADRSTNNLSDKGVTWESLWQFGNLTHNRLWVNIPQASAPHLDINSQASVKASYAYQMGFSAGKNIDPRLGFVKVEYTNEAWNAGDGNQGTQNLFRARSSPLTTAGASDFQKLSEMAAIDWFDAVKAFRQGVKDSGSTLQVRGEAPGFIANAFYSRYGLTRLQQVRGSDPEFRQILSTARLVIAPYAPGAPTDIGNIQPNDTAQSIINRTWDFVHANYPGWFAANKQVAADFGLAGIDLYEVMGLSTYDYTSGTNKLVDLNRTAPEAFAFERDFFGYTSSLTKDPDATLIVFGSAGIPYSENFGQWSPKEFYDSTLSPKAMGILDFIQHNATNVDPISVPEPTALPFLLGVGVMMRRRAA